jgi:hypothetical protein
MPAGTEARLDTPDAGADGTASLSAGITASATALVVVTGAWPFSVNAGDYPMDIMLNGERITLGSVPSGGVSPQSFTGVTRGVIPSSARVHSVGEPVEVFNVAIVGM